MKGYIVEVPDAASPRELSRAEARRAYNAFLESRAARVQMLGELVGRDGVTLGGSDAEVQALNDWFLSNLEPDLERSGEPMVVWYSIAHDIGIHLGEVMIARHPNLRWEFFTWGKKSRHFQRPVIMGFRTEDPKYHTNMDPPAAAQVYMRNALAERGHTVPQGTVEVRGVVIDLDAVERRHPPHADPTELVQWLTIAARRNGGDA
ncbi:hypothetical protein [Agromyces soli]|uniref:Uncharacterized protein n=1 Tax=Agromyces soli TaxID=659012 RepID=A0ABY4AWG0_9MICO|nr:hypothetical protein [Agromyces soli]UOE27518.1 hypothetical protein MTP13_07000 [Agromyces soli]